MACVDCLVCVRPTRRDRSGTPEAPGQTVWRLETDTEPSSEHSEPSAAHSAPLSEVSAAQRAPHPHHDSHVTTDHSGAARRGVRLLPILMADRSSAASTKTARHHNRSASLAAWWRLTRCDSGDGETTLTDERASSADCSDPGSPQTVPGSPPSGQRRRYSK